MDKCLKVVFTSETQGVFDHIQPEVMCEMHCDWGDWYQGTSLDMFSELSPWFSSRWVLLLAANWQDVS